MVNIIKKEDTVILLIFIYFLNHARVNLKERKNRLVFKVIVHEIIVKNIMYAMSYTENRFALFL